MVGHPFPEEKKTNSEGAVADWNTDFMNIIYYISDPKPGDVKKFMNSPLKYGCFVKEAVPIFVADLDQGRWFMEAPICLIDEKETKEATAEAERWLAKEDNRMVLFLVGLRTNMLLAIRVIGIKFEVVRFIKDSIRQQRILYKDYASYAAACTNIFNTITTEQMVAATQMHELKMTSDT
ncbi:MAG TPA: hypothetical protein VEA58_09410 [Anaerovoracaceae bacterium]|nr:hypothetical protein [Anaerovoracaceae bacterium]